MDKNYKGIAYKFGRKVHLDTLQCGHANGKCKTCEKLKFRYSKKAKNCPLLHLKFDATK